MSAGRVGKQRGFTLLGLMIVVAIMGAGFAAYGQLASHAAQREKEAELLFRGNQYRQAIESYYKKERKYPTELAQLLEDKRFPMPARHLRRLYADPISGEADWATMEAPGGGIMGVHSKSEAQPLKSGGFRLADKTFQDASRYADWQFFYTPPQ
jgi:prepilin-type N-terminal cleavage/methylation domain-containing protein